MASRDEIARLEAMHAANPEGRVFAHLAEAYRKSGELERAREVLQGGLARHPQYASAHVVLGRVLLDLSERDAADQAFGKVLELDPHNLVALRARADIAHERGLTDDAIRYYRELVTHDPSDEQAVLRIAELEARPAAERLTAATADGAETEPLAFQDATPIPATGSGDAAPIAEEPVLEYGEATLPHPGEEGAAQETAPPFEAADFGAVSIQPLEPEPAGSLGPAGGDVDLGLGGILEPTDVGTRSTAEESPALAAADAFAGLGAFTPANDATPDAVLDLSGLGGEFSLPTPQPEAFDLPVLEPAALDATTGESPDLEGPGLDLPAPPLPTAPSGEPAPAPAPAAPPVRSAGAGDWNAPDAASTPLVDSSREFDALWHTYDDGAAAALPDVGPELVTETIGDLYAAQGLHDRAADVYARLVETRPGDAALQRKLDAARAARTSAAPTSPAPAASGSPAPSQRSTAPGQFTDAPRGEPVVPPTPTVAEPAGPELIWGEPPAPDAPPVAAEMPPADAEVSKFASAMPWDEPATAPFTAAMPWDEPAASGAAAPTPAAPATPPADDSFALPTLADSGPDPFDLPALDMGGPSLDLPPEAAAPATTPSTAAPPTPPIAAGPPVVEPTAATEPPFVPMADLASEPGIGADTLPAPGAVPIGDTRAEVERVESAWTGRAGATEHTDSPFGWAEPEAAPHQPTIGEFLDSLVAWEPPAEAAPSTPAPEAAAGTAATSESMTPAAEIAPSITPTSTPAADDIDALFGDVPASASFASGAAAPPTPAAPPPAAAPAAPPIAPAGAGSGFDDIDALFGGPEAPAPTPDPWSSIVEPAAPPVVPPVPTAPTTMPAAPPVSSAEPAIASPAADSGGWDPFAELAPEPASPVPSPAPTVPGATSVPAGAGSTAVPAGPAAGAAGVGGSGGAFEWDPFAELPTEPAAPAAPATPEPVAETPTADEADDDEDIDMFRAWLQSLKR